jgi:putative oxidoreductase
MAIDAATAGAALLVARIAFGGVLAFMGLNHLLNAEDTSGYAASKGVPAASFLVPATGFQLIFGGLGILLGVYPVLAAGAVAVFLLVTTPVMHDFWTVEDPQQRQGEMTDFLKNVTTFGAAVAFLVLGGQEWLYAVGIGLF